MMSRSPSKVKIFTKAFIEHPIEGETIVPSGLIASLRGYHGSNIGIPGSTYTLLFWTNVTEFGEGNRAIDGKLVFDHEVRSNGEDGLSLIPIPEGGLRFKSGLHVDVLTTEDIVADMKCMVHLVYQ
jgi:hypothetical protein